LCLLLSACSGPWLGAGIIIGPDGVTVIPTVSGTIGVDVTASSTIN
jgi:hypothetical protein